MQHGAKFNDQILRVCILHNIHRYAHVYYTVISNVQKTQAYIYNQSLW